MAVYWQKAALFSEYYYEIGGVSFVFHYCRESRMLWIEYGIICVWPLVRSAIRFSLRKNNDKKSQLFFLLTVWNCRAFFVSRVSNGLKSITRETLLNLMRIQCKIQEPNIWQCDLTPMSREHSAWSIHTERFRLIDIHSGEIGPDHFEHMRSIRDLFLVNMVISMIINTERIRTKSRWMIKFESSR